MRRERIDQDAIFETHASVQLVGSHIVTVTGTQHLDLTADVELELATSHISSLAVIMFVLRTMWQAFNSCY